MLEGNGTGGKPGIHARFGVPTAQATATACLKTSIANQDNMFNVEIWIYKVLEVSVAPIPLVQGNIGA
jgi:hypothetical protein